MKGSSMIQGDAKAYLRDGWLAMNAISTSAATRKSPTSGALGPPAGPRGASDLLPWKRYVGDAESGRGVE